MKRSPRRTIFKVLVLFAAGAALNVAVAWGIRWSRGDDQSIQPAGNDRPLTAREVEWHHRQEQIRCAGMIQRTGMQRQHTMAIDEHSFGWRYTKFIVHLLGPAGSSTITVGGRTIPAASTGRGTAALLSRFQCGWPTASLHAVMGGNVNGWISEQGIKFERNRANKKVVYTLPTATIWPGFAVNTLFYAGVLWVLFCGPFALRRMIRRRRGQCARCAYPIGTNEVCTECGLLLGNISRDIVRLAE